MSNHIVPLRTYYLVFLTLIVCTAITVAVSFVDLGRFNCGTGCGALPTDNVSLRDNVFRAGVNYRFGWGK